MKISITKIIKYFAYLLSLIVILVVWYILSLKINAELIIPKPFSVLKDIIIQIKSKRFWIDFFNTFGRILISFLITIVLGGVLGFISAISRFIRHFLEVPLSALRTTPVMAVILLAVFIFPSGTVPVFVSVLMASPIFITSISDSFCSIKDDHPLIKMGKLYGYNKKQIFMYIKLPAAKEFIKSSMQTCFSLIWKIVIAGEILSLPKHALGAQLQQSQILLNTTSIVSITIIYITLNFIANKLFGLILKIGDKKL